MSPALPSLFVYPTRRCNYRCSYCFTNSDATYSRETFVLGIWQRLIDETRAAGIGEIRLSGGEPLLIHDIESRCKAIGDSGLSYTITTNGALLAKHLDWMQDAQPSTLWVSYHREYVEPQQFLVTVGAVCARQIRVGINLFDLDVVAFPNLIKQLIQVGATRFKLISTTQIGRAANLDKRFTFDRDKFRQIVEIHRHDLSNLVDIRAAFPLVKSTLTGSQSCVLNERSLLSVDFDGKVYPCCVTVGQANALIGDLAIESLANVVARLAGRSQVLPCQQQLPTVASGETGCPLALAAIRESAS